MQSGCARVPGRPGAGLTWIKAPGRRPVKIGGTVIGPKESDMSRISAVLLLAALAPAVPAVAADAARGQALYESRCGECHTKSVHQRESRKATTFAGVLAQVGRWNDTLGGDWTAEDIEDVAVYLNQRYYKYPCPTAVCSVGSALGARSARMATR